MVVNYLGDGAFRLQNGETTLLVDPQSGRFKADVTLRTLSSAAFATSGAPETPQNEFAFPGEYEIKGIEISGAGVPQESTEKFVKTVYSVVWDEIKLAFLGHLSRPPAVEILDKLNEPDILFLPTGGGHFLEPAAAAKLVRQLEPAIIVPYFFKNPNDFVKASGLKSETQEKLVFKKKDLEGGKGRIIILKAA